jgi:hypothetical protein
MMAKEKQFITNEKAKNIFFLSVIIFFCAARISEYLLRGSLWGDEAMKAQSILTRNLLELCASPLDYSQSLPVGFLYFTKLLTMVFGGGEWVLRFPSLIFSFLTLWIFHLCSKNIFKTKYPLLGTAVFSSLSYFIGYSSELNAYMSDTFFVLLTIYLLYKNLSGRFKTIWLGVAYAVILWWSFPVVFFVAGCMIFKLASILISLRKKETTLPSNTDFIASGIFVLASLVACYFIWLSPTAQNIGEYENEFWKWTYLPLMPKNMSDLKLMARMMRELVSPLHLLVIPVAPFFCVGAAILLKKKNSIMFAVVISFISLIVASYFEKYPITARQTLFLSPLIILTTFVGVSETAQKLCNIKWIRVSSYIWYVMLVFSICFNRHVQLKIFIPFTQEGAYRNGTEVAKSIEYLNNNVSDKDVVYVAAHATPVFNYENNYPNYFKYWLAEPYYTDGNIIYGSLFSELKNKEAFKYNTVTNGEMLSKDLDAISKHSSVYIFTADTAADPATFYFDLFSELSKTGTIDAVSVYYDTYLFHYRRFES